MVLAFGKVLGRMGCFQGHSRMLVGERIEGESWVSSWCREKDFKRLLEHLAVTSVQKGRGWRNFGNSSPKRGNGLGGKRIHLCERKVVRDAGHWEKGGFRATEP